MDSWSQFITNPEEIKAFFQIDPSLSNVRLHEVIMMQDGPIISLRFDLERFPDPPPQKWSDAGYNTMQIKLTLSGSLKVSINAWRTDNVGSLFISKENGLIHLLFNSDGPQLQCSGDFLSVDRVSAYLKER